MNRKRQRTQLTVQLNNSLENIVGQESFSRTPKKYTLNLDESNNTRIFTTSSGANSFSTLGVTANYGTIQPDMNDPSYIAYTQWRRNKDKEKVIQRPSTTSVDTETLTKNMLRAKEEASLISSVIGITKPSISATPTVTTGNRITSILEAFEKSAYWTLKSLTELLNKKENDVRDDVLRYCNYIKRGVHARHYILKPEFRTHRTPAPDVSDLNG